MPGTGAGVGLGLAGGLDWTPLQLGSDLKLWLRPQSLSNPNRLLQTEDLTTTWTSTALTPTTGFTDPNGGSTAWNIVADDAVARFIAQDTQGFQAGSTEMMQFWCKRGAGHDGSSQSRFRFYDGVAGYNSDFLASATWELKTFTQTMNASSTRVSCNIYPDITTNQNSILVWHPQCEAGGTATPYKANAATAGGIVAQWDDSSGNGNHATQGTQASQPLVVSGALDNFSGAQFDGVDDALALTTELSASGAFEYWVVLDRSTASSSHYLFNGADNTLEYILLNNADPSAIVTSTATDAGKVVSTASVDVGSPVRLRVARDASNNMVAYENAVDITTGSPTMTGTEYFSLIGKRSNNSGYYDGLKYEIILLTSALSAQNVTNMNDYLSRRYPSV
jgi:hypothetical protein